MASAPASGRPDFDELLRQVRALQERVAALEERVGGAAAPPNPTLAAAPPATAEARPSLGQVTIVGKALLGIAGAYFLRALTEMHALPLAAGIAAGILYALFWLVRAARAAPGQRFLAAVHAATSVFILVPLLWETTVRFQAVSCWVTAGVVVFFSVFGLAICWHRGRACPVPAVVAWMTTLAGLFTVTALLLATDNLAPFILALLAMAAAVEFSACFDHWLGERWLVALVADLALLLLIFILTRPRGLPPGYAPIPLALALSALASLPAVYLTSAVVRTLALKLPFRAFEIAQAVAAFLLSMGGALALTASAVAAVSAFCLLGGAGCYVVSFVVIERRGRNFYTYSTFGLLLVFAGIDLLLSGLPLAAALSGLALVCFAAGRQTRRMQLEWHGALYLLLAAGLSGLAGWATARLLGSGQEWVAPDAAIGVSAAAALAGYAFVWRSVRWTHRWLALVVAADCAWTLGGFAAAALVPLCSTRETEFCPTLRTAVLIALAVAMGWIGKRWERVELVWLVYPLLVLTAYKLVAQDLLQGQTLPLFVSLFLYGGTLVLLPRVLQKARPA